MRKYLTLFCCLFMFSQIAIAQTQEGTIAALDAKNGFRDVKFGSTPTAYPGLKLQTEEGGVKFYRRSTDDFKLGDYQLSSIEYLVYNDKVYAVALRAKGAANSQGVQAVLHTLYGPPSTTSGVDREYWLGEKTSLSYSTVAALGTTIILISNNELADQKSAGVSKQNDAAAEESKKRLQQAASDL